MLLFCLLPPTKPVPINLILDLIRSVRHEDTRIHIGGTHFRLRTLEGGEELGVDQRRFGVFELRGHIPG